MKYIVKALAIPVIAFIPLFLFAQMDIIPLEKGDKVPDLKFELSIGANPSNYKEYSLSDFKGKLIILDFWGKTCHPCLLGMPEMLQLQNTLNDRVQVIVVTEDKSHEIQELWKKHRTKEWAKAGEQLLFASDNEQLAKLFPHPGRPTHVFIDPHGIYVMMVNEATTTIENVSKYLEGSKVEFINSIYSPLNPHEIGTWFNKRNIEELDSFSILCRGNVSSGTSGHMITIDSNSKTPIAVSFYNGPLLELYELAYSDWKPSVPVIGRIRFNRMVLEDVDSSLFFPPANKFESAKWWMHNVYTYYLKLPISRSSELFSRTRKEVDNLLELTSYIKKIRMRCYVLKKVEGIYKLTEEHSRKSVSTVRDTANEIISYKNATIRSIISGYLYKYLRDVEFKPLIDETGIIGVISIDLPWNEDLDRVSITSIIKHLNYYGLKLVEEEREIEMLCITGRNTK